MDNRVRAAILGTGSYLPEKRLTNQDLEKTLDTSDDWITSRTGIKCRRIAAPDQATSDLGVQAARKALADAQIGPEILDLILVATLSPDYLMPSTACLVQEKLGLGAQGVAAFDLNAACSGFVYALATAKAYVEAGVARHVLVIGAETLSRMVDYKDRGTCILFGDGAGACVVGPGQEYPSSHPIGKVRLFADGRGANSIVIPAGGSRFPATQATVDERLHFIRVEGREVFRFGVTKMVETIEQVLREDGLQAADIGLIIPHQANTRILEAAAERLDLPRELFFMNLDQYGNTSGGSVPLALDEAQRSGRLEKGKRVILIGFGAGLTWASAVLEW